MKRSALWVAPLLVVAMSLSLAGCGGGGDAPAAKPTGTGQTAAPPPPPTAAAPAVSSVSETSTARLFTVKPDTPKFFSDLLALKTPLTVLFYSKQAPVYGDVSKEVAAVEKRYGNQAEFLKVSMDEAYDMASLPSDKQAGAQEVTNLAEQLGVKFTPHIVIIDRNNMITYTHAGYIDAKTLEQELFKALKR